jgi:geranylgeranyl reductase
VNKSHTFDVIVVGGGPAGATAAHDLAQRGHSVMLLDRDGRTKPCGGAIPPRLIKDFEIPEHLLVARIRCARMVSPSDQRVDIPIEDGLRRHGRPRHLRRMAAQPRRLGRRGAPARHFDHLAAMTTAPASCTSTPVGVDRNEADVPGQCVRGV